MIISLEQLGDELMSALPALKGTRLVEEQRLGSLGIDSLTILTIIVGAASRYGLDLARMPEDIRTPEHVSDLLLLLRSLPVANAKAP